MATIELNGLQIEVYYANALTAGYGHKKIEVELCYEGEYKTFKATTNFMPGYDAAMDIEDTEAKYVALYELIDTQIEDEVIEWIDSL
nr:hypothetical protein [uncultured Flavobacterium sp.]